MKTNEPEMTAPLEIVRGVLEKLPFDRLLGLKVSYLRADGAGFEFAMKNELIGNVVQGILYGKRCWRSTKEAGA